MAFLGRVEPLDALNPAERVLMRTLKEHAVWYLDAMAAIGGAEDRERPAKAIDKAATHRYNHSRRALHSG